MTPFAEPAPRLFALPPGASFATAFAHGFHARFAGADPVLIARTRIMVNTAQARRVIEHALADCAPHPGPLPQMVLMADLYRDTVICPDIPPAIPALRRRLRLIRLVEGYLKARQATGVRTAPLSAAPDLAESLALLMDQFHDEGAEPAALTGAIADAGLTQEAAEHWNQALAFLDLVRAKWPELRDADEEGALDPRERQRAVVERMARDWAGNPPDAPVIAAASTGSVGTTAHLLAAIARLPQGAVVLPGFDPATPPDIWRAAGPEHPLGPFKGLFELLECAPEEVTLWHGQAETPRLTLVAQAMRPAPVTDHWHRAARSLAEAAAPAIEGISVVEADSPPREAEAITVAIRQVLDTPGKTVALITPDAELARRVAAQLERFGITPDDTLGQPLHLSPPGVLIRLILEVATAPVPDPVRIAGLLQHPLVAPGMERAVQRDMARAYERAVLRTPLVAMGTGVLPDWPDADPEQAAWLERVSLLLTELRELIPTASLDALVAAHSAVAEALSDDGTGPKVWQEPAGEALAALLGDLRDHADAYGDGTAADYHALIMALMRGEQVTPLPRQVHPRVSFIGPREARLESADTVILAGLNDGVWPAVPDPGPWLSRPMRVALGVPVPERSVGLSAHDFLNAACRAEVVLTRARKVDGSATVPSRWLIRIETLLNGIGAGAVWQAAKDRGNVLQQHARGLRLPVTDIPRAQRPGPVPPPDARPRRLSVTDIEELVRDAYAVYARHVLGLRALEPLGREADARMRGTVLHRILDAFIRRTQPWPGEAETRSILMAATDEVLATGVAEPEMRRAWRARVERFSDWLIAEEARRRDHGAPAATETRGRISLPLPGGPFELHARADRIDRLGDGAGAVYDYKTGSPPTAGQIKAGFNHQVHLQAAMLARGGFEETGPLLPVEGAYIGLGGSRGTGAVTDVDDLAAGAESHLAELIELLGRYDAGAPFVSRGRPQMLTYESDYDHLARVGEWTAEDGE